MVMLIVWLCSMPHWFNWQRQLFLSYFHCGLSAADRMHSICESNRFLINRSLAVDGHWLWPDHMAQERGDDHRRNGIWIAIGKPWRACRWHSIDSEWSSRDSTASSSRHFQCVLLWMNSIESNRKPNGNLQNNILPKIHQSLFVLMIVIRMGFLCKIEIVHLFLTISHFALAIFCKSSNKYSSRNWLWTGTHTHTHAQKER